MNITKSTFPSSSNLLTSNVKYDYIDSFMGSFIDDSDKVKVEDVAKSFFNSGPKWVGKLFWLRNQIVKLFGLKTSNPQKDKEERLKNFTCNPGEQLGLFKVYSKSDSEIVLGEDDTHLNFRVSILLKKDKESPKKDLILSTTVQFNNWFGKFYFLPVKPFHKLIVPAMMKGIIKNLEY